MSDMFCTSRIARLVLGIALVCISVSLCSTSQAGFLDTFNTENGGVGKLNYTGFANWNVTAGSVDLIGNGLFDIYPGNGLYVDLNGSTGVSGTLTSKVLFSPGTYEFSFEIGNNIGGSNNPNSVTVSVGNYDQTFTRTGAVPLETIRADVTITTASAIVFATPSSDSDDIGIIIDNVSLSSVPEPSSAVLAAIGALGSVGVGWLSKKKTVNRKPV
jgi:hypothetical protein